MASQAEVAEHLFLARQTVSEMMADGRLPDRGRGAADLDECRRIYIKHLREVAAGRASAGGGLDLVAERARKAKEEADGLEMKNAQLRGELLAREDVDAAVTAAFSRVQARLLAIPSKAAPRVVGLDIRQIAERLRSAIEEALHELADTTVADLCGPDGELVDDPMTAKRPGQGES